MLSVRTTGELHCRIMSLTNLCIVKLDLFRYAISHVIILGTIRYYSTNENAQVEVTKLREIRLEEYDIA